MAESAIIGLAHINIKVRNIETSIGFYRDLLGFTLTERCALDDGTLMAFLHAGDCRLELAQPVQSAAYTSGMVDHIGIRVKGIDALVDRLKDKISFNSPVNAAPDLLGGIKFVFFNGPDQESIEFFEYLNR
jgi:lactoylglutathione lyase